MAKSIKELEKMVVNEDQPKGTTKIEKQFFQGGVTRSFYVVDKAITDKIKELEKGCSDFHWCGKEYQCPKCRLKIQVLKELLEGSK